MASAEEPDASESDRVREETGTWVLLQNTVSGATETGIAKGNGLVISEEHDRGFSTELWEVVDTADKRGGLDE